MTFPTPISAILDRIKKINPRDYASSRNYSDGAVTYLSPYISRGVISTKQIYHHIRALDLPWWQSEKLVQELAWRDYWQQIWIAKGEDINTDLKHTQQGILNHQIPSAVVEADTGIEAVDQAIESLYKTGYMHNHMRMYVASICCNMAHCHWLAPAKWMYSHLLDGDLASNQLSWQWVAGAFSNKKYYANQENINKYFHSKQENTFLDVDYSAFDDFQTPPILTELTPLESSNQVNKTTNPVLDKNKTTLVYNYYNLDPYWHENEEMQRVLLIEPDVFEKNQVSAKCMDFITALSKNIDGIKVFIGSFDQLYSELHHDPHSKLDATVNSKLNTDKIIFKEHPLNAHYKGICEDRDWLCGVKGYHASFFSFWKKCKKELRQ